MLKNRIRQIVNETIQGVLNEGIMDDYEHEIEQRESAIVAWLDKIGKKYPSYISSDIEGWQLYMDFGQMVIKIGHDDDKFYIVEIDGITMDDDNPSIWNEVCQCVLELNQYFINGNVPHFKQ